MFTCILIHICICIWPHIYIYIYMYCVLPSQAAPSQRAARADSPKPRRAGDTQVMMHAYNTEAFDSGVRGVKFALGGRQTARLQLLAVLACCACLLVCLLDCWPACLIACWSRVHGRGSDPEISFGASCGGPRAATLSVCLFAFLLACLLRLVACSLACLPACLLDCLTAIRPTYIYIYIYILYMY